jgi:hypothetical protein
MIWLIIRIVLQLLPVLIQGIRDGRIRSAAQDEVLKELLASHEKRLNDAIRAGEGPFLNEEDDPNNRSRGSRS